ncbi:ABR103Cp [Eremothecium gossypii ATCC 10895]|uniref:ABR103Cp n=1 Tax=Eremothecium gossypii (strain ATCC 10895 / CBS 109.51 / FGSC 9923 / NRRL Y-1056) TaxID=284811 RepID=Q75DC3_EREGS|nr:ABR103Cp [Eremothecium gossypii ATCC 10895]AAS50874.1 ABR103Cp [Eremothecium gossypii ATCC 10895]AEY95163.1 FABR103Cp [Eremothecium gossypii FDAG1]
MSRHQFDLVMCMKLPGTSIGRLCERCDGKCPSCDSNVRPLSKVRICDQCSFGGQGKKCILCGSIGVSDAYYCWECCKLEKDRDGCPRILNVGSNKTDRHFDRKLTER